MHDIYHTLTKYRFNSDAEADLKSHINASTDAYHGIMSGLQLIGNLAVAASSQTNGNYDPDDAKCDLFLLGSALTQLTRIAEAINYNRESAEYALTQLKHGGAS